VTWITSHMNNRDLAVRGAGAPMGWHDRAILTSASPTTSTILNCVSDVVPRHVEANAQRNNIEPDWVYGVLRRKVHS